MTQIKGLLVDLDGTLVDTGQANYLAYAEALSAIGVSVTREAFNEIAFGRNWAQFLPALLEGTNTGADPAAIAAHKARIYSGKLQHTALNEALVALIASGRPHWQTALVTTASSSNVAAVLDFHQIRDLFDTIVTGSDVAQHKPHPEAYAVAADRLNLAPSECLAIEDSSIGVASARAFGAHCLQIRFEGSSL